MNQQRSTEGHVDPPDLHRFSPWPLLRQRREGAKQRGQLLLVTSRLERCKPAVGFATP